MVAHTTELLRRSSAEKETLLPWSTRARSAVSACMPASVAAAWKAEIEAVLALATVPEVLVLASYTVAVKGAAMETWGMMLETALATTFMMTAVAETSLAYVAMKLLMAPRESADCM